MRIRSRAPLRLGIGGGGTDVAPYCDEFGGLVLNAAINRFCHVTLTPRRDGHLSLDAPDIEASWTGVAESVLEPSTGAPSLMRGVYNRIVKDFNAGEPISVDITSYADAPAGSGLGTSSSMVVALLAAFLDLIDVPLDNYALAQLAFDIERKDLGFAGGRQDQYAAAFGGINFMEFGSNEQTLVNQLRIDRHVELELESSLIIYFTGQSRDSATIIEQQKESVRPQQSERARAMHSLKDSARQMKEALQRGRMHDLARQLDESWKFKKRTSDKISTAEIDAVYNAALANGAYGGKVSGAGGGGFMMFIVDPTQREKLLKVLRNFGGNPQTCGIWHSGAETWRV